MYFDDQKFLERLGQAIRTERKRNGYTQEELAYNAGIHKNFVGLLERGKRAPTIITMQKLCSVFGISLGDFFQQNNM
jgi:transcriptional regulator with XRE-family HTH domain